MINYNKEAMRHIDYLYKYYKLNNKDIKVNDILNILQSMKNILDESLKVAK